MTISYLIISNLIYSQSNNLSSSSVTSKTHVVGAKGILGMVDVFKEDLEKNNGLLKLRRLHSFIAAENHHFEVTLQCLKAKSNTIYHTVKEFTTRHIRINSHNLARAFQTFSFTGFTGDKTVGMKKNSSVLNHSLTHADVLADQQKLDGDETDEAESDMDGDEACGVVGGLVDYVSELSLRPISL
ncbi:uncharacterized protein EDB93DRAFT_1245852 [Suillus bovinus]|uniref:uncharacterized protein n=1 Tax=Suillus bovinus TaxID=48563 RepID=UPI001B8680B1|nr:uncharacterized protein EDB93DRAFT_1245852 [Suillus bovinus]KAG2158623.1 hypothetical protein EDB93DRAFT_1245852 [Suillus bovinus]